MKNELRELIKLLIRYDYHLSINDAEGMILPKTTDSHVVLEHLAELEECEVCVWKCDSPTSKLVGQLFCVDQELNDFTDSRILLALVDSVRNPGL